MRISLLPTSHPPLLQQRLVRTSNRFYPIFILLMGSSPRFGSSAWYLAPVKTRFRYASRYKNPLSLHHTANSLARSTKSRPSPINRLRLIFSKEFQVLFHSPYRGAFHLSLMVLVHYRSQNLFSLGRWSSQIQAGFHVSDFTQEHSGILPYFRLRDCHPLWSPFPGAFD